MLTAKHKQARVTFAKAVLRSEKCSWRQGKLGLTLNPKGKPACRWCTPATRGTVARPKHSIAAHVYMGISYHDVTSLKFVTGTHKQVSKYISPKSKLPHKGVAGREYTDMLREFFIPQGHQVFSLVACGKTSGRGGRTMLFLRQQLQICSSSPPMSPGVIC